MKQKVIIVNCCVCGKPVKCKGKKPWATSLAKAKEGTVCCSRECFVIRKKERLGRSANFLRDYNKNYASERMKRNNPMFDPAIVEKMKAVKRTNGTLHVWPGKRGGNGQHTPSQILLATALGWPMEVAIKTGHHQQDGSGFPACYKADVGNKKLKIAIEVDGKDHNGKKKKLQDQKKEQKLNGLGWKVLRFTNEQIGNDLPTCLQKITSTI